MVVQDDGRGFDVTVNRGLGLVGMEERVRRLGGEFEVQSEPGKGALVRVNCRLTRRVARRQPQPGRRAEDPAAALAPRNPPYTGGTVAVRRQNAAMLENQ